MVTVKLPLVNPTRELGLGQRIQLLEPVHPSNTALPSQQHASMHFLPSSGTLRMAQQALSLSTLVCPGKEIEK